MIRVIALLKRKPGLTREAFRAHYEEHHAALGVKYLTAATYYARHYLTPIAEPLEGAVAEPAYDVLTELRFDDMAAFEAGMAQLQMPEAHAAISADEELLFDRSSNRLVMVETCVSDLTVGNVLR
jgi:hypothetical protein